MKYTIIGVLWKDDYEDRLFYEKKIHNPDYKVEHASCRHVRLLSEKDESDTDKNVTYITEEQLLQKSLAKEFCAQCGRRIRMIKHKPFVTVKKTYSWVTTYDKDSIDSLVLTNPWNLHEYIITHDRVRNKNWLSC